MILSLHSEFMIQRPRPVDIKNREFLFLIFWNCCWPSIITGPQWGAGKTDPVQFQITLISKHLNDCLLV